MSGIWDLLTTMGYVHLTFFLLVVVLTALCTSSRFSASSPMATKVLAGVSGLYGVACVIFLVMRWLDGKPSHGNSFGETFPQILSVIGLPMVVIIVVIFVPACLVGRWIGDKFNEKLPPPSPPL